MSDFLDRLSGVDVGGGFKLLTTMEGQWVFAHDDDEGDYCGMAGLPNHDVIYDENGAVTVKPSILCKECGRHGFVKDDQWREA